MPEKQVAKQSRLMWAGCYLFLHPAFQIHAAVKYPRNFDLIAFELSVKDDVLPNPIPKNIVIYFAIIPTKSTSIC